jgi:hypothetical protein
MRDFFAIAPMQDQASFRTRILGEESLLLLFRVCEKRRGTSSFFDESVR